MSQRELSNKAAKLVCKFEESVIRYHAAKHPSRKEFESYESARKELLDYFQKLENMAYNLIIEGAKLGINSDKWDTQVNEYRHWDL